MTIIFIITDTVSATLTSLQPVPAVCHIFLTCLILYTISNIVVITSISRLRKWRLIEIKHFAKVHIVIK